MIKLKPCPFCGCENIYIDGYKHGAGLRWRVMCLDCMGMVDPGTIQQKYRAIELWNRRAEPKEADFDCEHCKHLKPSNKTNRLFCSYHSEGEHQYEVFKDEYCSYFERAESSREGQE